LKSYLSFWDRPEGIGALIGLTALSLFLAVFLFVPTRAGASDDFVVSIYADETTRTFRTSGGSVSSVLEKAGVNVGLDDLVEPGLDEELKGPVFNINIFRARPVLVIDGLKEYVVNSPFNSARLIAEDAGLELYQEDYVELGRIDDFVGAGIIGERLVITRATPVVIDLYGKRINHRTHVRTVGELLAEKDIVDISSDIHSHSNDVFLHGGMVVSIIRVGVQVEIVDESIAFDTEIIWDDNVSYGYESIEQAGVNGERSVTYEIEYHNGEEVGRIELQSVVSVEPITRVLRVGTLVPDGIENRVIGQQLAEANGWVGQQWICLLHLWDKESQWNHQAQNPYSTAYGIPQFLDSTWAGTGYPKTADPATQIQAGMTYIQNRYGTPCNAWQHSIDNNWY